MQEKLQDVAYHWPSNIKSFEKKIMGISIMEMMSGAMAGMLVFALLYKGIGVSVAGGLAITAFVGTLAVIMKPERFNNMPLPVYLYQRSQAASRLELPLIISNSVDGEIVIESWDGEIMGTVD